MPLDRRYFPVAEMITQECVTRFAVQADRQDGHPNSVLVHVTDKTARYSLSKTLVPDCAKDFKGQVIYQVKLYSGRPGCRLAKPNR
jgi:hypothetical protein